MSKVIDIVSGAISALYLLSKMVINRNRPHDANEFNYTYNGYSFFFNDNLLRVMKDNCSFTIDCDPHAFGQSVLPPVFICMGYDTIIMHEVPALETRLYHIVGLEPVKYEINEFESEEQHFQYGTIMDIPSYETMKDIEEVVLYMAGRSNRLQSTMKYDDIPKIPFDEYFEYCAQKLGG